MVFAFAVAATLCSSLFAIATSQRAQQGRGPHQSAWTVALALFALASAALAVGTSTGWDDGTYRVFYGAGAILSVPWLGLGTVFLLLGGRGGRAARGGLVFFSGLTVGALALARMEPVSGTEIPVGKDVFPQALPRVLAAVGSGVGATVVIVGALVSVARLVRAPRTPGRARFGGANVLIALGTLILSSGGLIQGLVGDDEAFALSLALGITVIYAGFLVAEGARSPARAPISAAPPSAAAGSHGQ
ncbi:MAG: hypothetical protein AMXMBFR46_24150 [Acidimicrobiia bacterium]